MTQADIGMAITAGIVVLFLLLPTAEETLHQRVQRMAFFLCASAAVVTFVSEIFHG